MDQLKQKQILDLVMNRPDLTYPQIAIITNTNDSAIRKLVRKNGLQRKQGAKSKVVV